MQDFQAEIIGFTIVSIVVIILGFYEVKVNKIETDISIGLKYKEEQSKLWDNLFDNINFI